MEIIALAVFKKTPSYERSADSQQQLFGPHLPQS